MEFGRTVPAPNIRGLRPDEEQSCEEVGEARQDQKGLMIGPHSLPMRDFLIATQNRQTDFYEDQSNQR